VGANQRHIFEFGSVLPHDVLLLTKRQDLFPVRRHPPRISGRPCGLVGKHMATYGE